MATLVILPRKKREMDREIENGVDNSVFSRNPWGVTWEILGRWVFPQSPHHYSETALLETTWDLHIDKLKDFSHYWLFSHLINTYVVTSCAKHCAFGGLGGKIEFSAIKPHNIKPICYYSTVIRVWIVWIARVLGLFFLLDIFLRVFLSFSGSRKF